MNVWEIQEARQAIRDGHYDLAERYLEKALERVWCMYCHGPLGEDRPYREHFKGFVHLDCAEKYDGRGDYLHQHPEEDQ